MRRAAVPLLLAALTLAVYAQVASFEFISFDDPGYVGDNPHVLNGLTREDVLWAFTTTSQANWHPLTWLSLQLDAQLAGPSPRAFHTTNALLHVVNVVLLFLLFSRLTSSTWRSALVAVLFAVHPLHVESIAWVAERKDVLCTAFGLLACLLWIDKRRAWAVVAYAASLLAKPMLVSLPILLLLLDLWPLRRPESWKRLIAEKIPFFALAAASCLVTVFVQSQGGATRALKHFPPMTRAANAAVTSVMYLVKAVWPSGLAVFYPYPYDGIAAWKVIGALAVLAGVTAGVIRLRSQAPYLLVGWVWYLVTLVPVIGIIQVGSQAMADRYTYVPLIGPFAALAFALPARPKRLAAALASTAVAALAVLAFRQAGYWRDSVTLFTRTLAVTKENAMAHNSLAKALFERGQLDRAVEECAEAVRIAPGMGDAQSNLVRGLLAQGKTAEAAAKTQEALRDRPDDSRTHVNAGLIARYQGRDDLAVSSFRQALRLDPSDEEAHLNLGAVLADLGKRDEAAAEFEAAARLRPGDVRARQALDSLRH
jgi:Tfp pilus assembly protein PilF